MMSQTHDDMTEKRTEGFNRLQHRLCVSSQVSQHIAWPFFCHHHP